MKVCGGTITIEMNAALTIAFLSGVPLSIDTNRGRCFIISAYGRVRHYGETQTTNCTDLVHLRNDQHQEPSICPTFCNEVLDKVDDTRRCSLSVGEDMQST